MGQGNRGVGGPPPRVEARVPAWVVERLEAGRHRLVLVPEPDANEELVAEGAPLGSGVVSAVPGRPRLPVTTWPCKAVHELGALAPAEALPAVPAAPGGAPAVPERGACCATCGRLGHRACETCRRCLPPFGWRSR